MGPRSTGKTFLLEKLLPPENCSYINLLSSDVFLRLSAEPGLLGEMIDSHHKGVKRAGQMAVPKAVQIAVIDEIQRLPELLNEVHRLIEERGIRFLLTGSSARRLKREHANMLGGRAGMLNFFPLVYPEIPRFDLKRYLTVGGLPRVYAAEDPALELEAYVSVYLEQEIKIEANIRRLGPFSRFLKAAALSNGELINYANIASDAGVPASTVREYYSVLEDTLIGIVLDPWVKSEKRKAIQTAKFYFFDTGVCNYILGLHQLDRNSNFWGKSFEQYICLELKAYLSYFQRSKKLSFWRSINKQEVDFIIDDEIAIEVKSTKKVIPKHLAGIRALKEEEKLRKFYLVSDDPIERMHEGVSIIHWRSFLKALWAGGII